ncbi:hypothetical protein [Winogradskyella costae]|uniref:hypothetical protein n=1 Tax=Winogradskyella costae TaxID=2697008 RepID=UPI0015CBAA95|nr:hypothetical protein [Winogradskyella costae]
MKTEKIIIILILTLIFSCQNEKKKSEIITDSKIELGKNISKAESKLDSNLNAKNSSENLTFRKITELDKYKEFTEIVGMVLDGTDKALSYIQKDSIQVLILEQVIRDNTSKVKFEILDEVQLVADKSKLFSEPTDCKLTEEPDERFIFGIAKYQEKEYFDKDHILKVWKIDLTDNKFKEIKPEKVKCFNHWFGYDE